MSYDDLGRTRVLVRDKNVSAGNRLDDTQELPSLSHDTAPVFPRKRNVRELPPRSPQYTGSDHAANIMDRRQKRILWVFAFAACFLLALFCGILLSQTFRDHEQTLADSRKEAQQMEMRQQELAAREDSLKKQRDSIAEQKRTLEERELELERKAQRAAGRTERIEQEKSKSSVVGDWMDKVTGKEKERKEADAKNAAEIQQTNLDIASVQQSIRDAQVILDEVDNQLDNVNEMKDQADRLKTAAQDTYMKNEGMLTNILQYMSEGVDLLRQILR